MVKRIAYIVGNFPSKSETWINHEIIQLMKEGFDVKIFSFREKKPLPSLDEHTILVKNTIYRDNKLLHIQFSKNVLKNLKTIFKICKEINKHFWNDTRGLRGKLQVIKDLLLFINKVDEIKYFSPDLVIVHFANHRANAALYNYILHKTPYIIKMHATDVFNRPNLFRLKVENAYKLLTISNYNINFIRQRDKDLDISKFIVHHCGISLDKYEFKNVSEKKNKIPVILSVARLTEMKGFATLIKASSLLHNKGLKHQLIIAGYGPDKKSLVEFSNSLDIQNFVEFKDYCSPEEVKNLLSTSDVFVIACKYDSKRKTQDGIPVALMEAMATGLPVISTKLSGIPELIDDGVNGFLANPDDPTDLMNKMEEVLKMSEIRLQQITNNARTKIEKDFNAEKLTNELKNLFVSESDHFHHKTSYAN